MDVDFGAELDEVVVLVVDAPPSEVLLVPAAPPETAVPGRLTVALAARAWKFASERDAFALTFSLMTMVIPFWQCFPCEQYNQIGVVLFIWMVYVGVVVEAAVTGMKPLKIPAEAEFIEMGWQGWSKVDWVTVWLAGANWNCTMSPTAAVTLLGKYAKLPLLALTRTT